MAWNHIIFTSFYKVSYSLFSRVTKSNIANGFWCFAKVAESRRGILKMQMVFNRFCIQNVKRTGNDMGNDRFYKGFLVHFAAVAESCIPNGFP